MVHLKPKKILLIILGMILIIAQTSVFAEEVFPSHEPYGIGVELVMANGVESKPTLSIENGNIIVKNATENGTLILAFYNDLAFVGVRTYHGSGTTETDIANAPTGATGVKAFYWDMQTIMPLTNMVSLPLTDPDGEDNSMKIRVTAGKLEVVFALNQTSAAISLYNQLPMMVDVQNYSNNEKIFYPEKLDCTDVVEGDCPAGTLAYFSPWGDVVMYYGNASRYSGLYILGEAVEGAENIRDLSGKIEITKVEKEN